MRKGSEEKLTKFFFFFLFFSRSKSDFKVVARLEHDFEQPIREKRDTFLFVSVAVPSAVCV